MRLRSFVCRLLTAAIMMPLPVRDYDAAIRDLDEMWRSLFHAGAIKPVALNRGVRAANAAVGADCRHLRRGRHLRQSRCIVVDHQVKRPVPYFGQRKDRRRRVRAVVDVHARENRERE